MKNERGSLLVALLLGLTGLMGILALFDYFNSAHTSLKYAKNVGAIQADVTPVTSRIMTCVTHLSSGDCPPSPFDLTELRKTMSLSETTVNPINFTMADLQALGLGTGYAAAAATITRMATSDDIWYGATNISIALKITPAASTHLAPRTVNRNFRVTIESPVTWALMLRKNNAVAFNLDATSKVRVYGGVALWSNNPAKIAPSNVISAATAMNLWADHLDITAKEFDIKSSVPGDVPTFNYLRALGLKMNALDGVWDPFGNSEWQERLDYGYVYGANSFPLPENANHMASLGNGGPSPGDIVVARADTTTYPDAAVMPGKGLETTCERPADFQRGSSHSLILSRINDDLTFDYDAPGLLAHYACGLIVANSISIHTKAGETHVWYGHLNAKQLIVTGGGTFIIVNPFDPTSRPSDLPAPGDMALADMAETDLSLASSTAFNFFVPFVGNQNQLPAGPSPALDLRYRRLKDIFDDTCIGGTRSCWQTTVDPPDMSIWLKQCSTSPCWYDALHLNIREGM